ncbi:glycine--tRNA ligase, mitochondrial 1-like isoform X2 [Papaver somniferum]|nr:glycine--tRNA ligase, mitochondrial 1-like isoform X2 [Papaver somniferum]
MFPSEEQIAGKDAIKLLLGDAGTVNNETLGNFIGRVYLFLTRLGISIERLGFHQHLANEMAHYAADWWDAVTECSLWLDRVCRYCRYSVQLTRSLVVLPLLLMRSSQHQKQWRNWLLLQCRRSWLDLAFKGNQKKIVEALEAMDEKEAMEV